MSLPRKYSPEQITAIRALAALRPKVPHALIADAVGVNIETVRYHLYGRSKATITEPWALDLVEACAQRIKGQNAVAAYYLVSAAKHLLKK